MTGTTKWSAAPIVVDGITVSVKHPISPKRRSEEKAHMRALGRSDRSPKDVELDYLAWRRELSGDDCDHKDAEGRAGCERCGKLWP